MSGSSAPARLTVGTLLPADTQRWDAFVDGCPDATFFHRAGWQRVIERAFGHRTHFLYAQRDGRIAAVLPLAQVKSLLFGHTLCSLPFCVYGGIASDLPAAANALDTEAQRLAARLGVDHLEYRHSQPRQSGWHRSDLYATFRKALLPDPEQNMLAIPRKQRAMVRKGIAAQLRSTIEPDIDDFYAIYSASVHRLGTPVFAKRYFRILKEVFGDDCELMSVRDQGKTICAVLSFFFRGEVLPYYGGGGAAARSLAGNDFMYWETMRRGCERGCTLFDFGRSKRGTGSFDFKKNWGFEAQSLHYEYQLHRARSVPAQHPLNPRYRLAIRAWKAMPLALANMLGPHIVRNLG
ncbi:MAG: FemAB family XrtA/PEP-CTERM system-associated protein [Pseudomonadota bacterium]